MGVGNVAVGSLILFAMPFAVLPLRFSTSKLFCALAAYIDVTIARGFAFVVVRVLGLTFCDLKFDYSARESKVLGYSALIGALSLCLRRVS